MQEAPLLPNETERLQRLYGFGVLDTLPQGAFDDITALASAICGTPIALISLIDRDRQWFKSRVGLEALQTPREVAFCSHAINEPQKVMEVEDATLDWRFKDNPLVTSAPDIRFYAGAPIVTDDGFALGTVCVIDRRTRTLDDTQRRALKSLADLVVTLLEHEKEHHELHMHRAAAAAQQTELLAALTAAGLDLISFVDADYVYRYVNDRYLKYFDKTASEIVGRSMIELVGPDLFHQTVKPNFDLALAGNEVDYEIQFDFPTVGPRFLHVTYLPVSNEADLVTGLVIRIQDINALKTNEALLQDTVTKLQHKTLEQERFIHIISHDLREPINTITNFAGLLEGDEDLNLPDHAKRYLRFVRTGGLRMKSLLEDLVNFLHLDKHAVQRRPVDLTQLAVEIRDDLSAALSSKGGRIEFGHLHGATGDGTLLRILLQNLVSNALKFTPKGTPPVVQITSTQTEGMIHVQVSDNGIGIPEDQAEKIFGMFTRLHSKKEFEGSGLGLSICKRIAELHAGHISLTSKLGHGSCFTLHLPVVPAVLDERSGDEYL